MNKAPQKLWQLQRWFAATIAKPLRQDNRLVGTNVHKEATQYIAPSPKLESCQRIEIYHQQYWWRLLRVLQENFPLVTRLFGHTPFNQQLAIPYLSENLPSHWALCRLGQSLPAWIRNNYAGEDRELVATAAEIDAAAQQAFWIKALPPIPFETLSEEQRLNKAITLQPHLHLFELKGDLFSFREAFLKQEVNYWNDHPFPKMNFKRSYFVLYRDLKNRVTWKEMTYGAHQFLSCLKKELTLAETCAKIEQQGGKVLEEAQEQMPLWLHEWTTLQWLGEKQ